MKTVINLKANDGFNLHYFVDPYGWAISKTILPLISPFFISSNTELIFSSFAA